jgi:hypothetical protein
MGVLLMHIFLLVNGQFGGNKPVAVATGTESGCGWSGQARLTIGPVHDRQAREIPRESDIDLRMIARKCKSGAAIGWRNRQ